MIILIVQHNHEHRYKSEAMILEIALNIKAGLFLLEKSFIINQKLVYSIFNFDLP